MTRQEKMAAVFNEWARQYAKNSDSFDGILDENGQPFKNYGEAAAATYIRIEKELEFKRSKKIFPSPAVTPSNRNQK